MTVRGRILLFQILILALVGLISGLALATLHLTEEFVRRVDSVHGRFEALAELNGQANNYTEQVAEVLLLGPEQMPDFEAARRELYFGFHKLEGATREELGALGFWSDRSQEEGELEFVGRIKALFEAIDRAAQRLFSQRSRGEPAGIVESFRNDVEHRLESDFEGMIEAALHEERSEVGAELERVRGAQWHLLLMTGGSSTLLMLGSLGFGLVLRRSIAAPVRELNESAKAIAAGKLHHRIPAAGRDEFASLSRSFNSMAEALEIERAALISVQGRLEAEVQLRTRELREANKQLRALNSRRIQFFAEASHELRTPLTILRGEADVALRDQPRVRPYGEALNRIRNYAEDMARNLEDLLAVARSEAEDMSFSSQIIDVGEVVKAAVQEASVLATPKQISVDLSLNADHSLIRGDAQRLKQALLIGFDNAIKYSKPHQTISVEMTGRDGALEIVVRDSGSGIGASDLPFVFDRYYRGHAGERSVADGLGVGLAIAKKIIDRHDGTIGLERIEPSGTLLRIKLPLVQHTDDSNPDR
ncbi:ATP-binding protein [Mesorhizobium sp. M0870]|uniref:sensor histidine kinase n=1 Tax=Mesorhizobium sp. M0870 TaxID=2957016 RepID=UPI00333C339F